MRTISRCIVCGSNAQPVYKEFIVMCSTCGLMWNRYPPSFLEEVFKNSEETDGGESRPSENGKITFFELLCKQRTKALTPNLSPTCVLEIGAQQGEYLNMLKEVWPNCKMVGVDPCSVSKEVRSTTFEKVRFKSQSFDLIMSTNVFYRHTNPVDVIKKMHRIIRPDGYLYLELGMLTNEWSYFSGSEVRDSAMSWFVTRQPIYYFYDIEHILMLFSRYGFNVVSRGEIYYGPQKYTWLGFQPYYLTKLREEIIGRFEENCPGLLELETA